MMKGSSKAWLGLIAAGSVSGAVAGDWPQWMGAERDGVWRETGIIERFPDGGPEVLWRIPIGSGYSGPAVADGRVYVMDRLWPDGAVLPSNPFDRGTLAGRERVLCLESATGRIRWIHDYACDYTVSYPSGPRVTPVVAGDRLVTLGAEGHLKVLDRETGAPLWGRHFPADYGVPTPLWGFSAHPLVYGGKVICLVGGEGTTAVAFGLESGREVWRALSAKEPGYCPPTLVRVEDRDVLIVWHPEALNALDPDTGEVLWTLPWSIRTGLTVAVPRVAGDRMFLSSFYSGSALARFDASSAEWLWRTEKASERDTTHLHTIMSTPVVRDGHVYGVCSYGQLRCLRLGTGERLWETMAATTGGEPERWANAFLVSQGDRYFLFNERGDLIIARLTPEGYDELDRAHLLEPDGRDMRRRPIVWSHPAFADRAVFVRNDSEIAAFSLAARP